MGTEDSLQRSANRLGPERGLSCVRMPHRRDTVARPWFRRWYTSFVDRPLAIKPAHQEAVACLLPALLCGEQSAISVFTAEAERLSRQAREVSVSLFRSIVADENLHERGLQLLSGKLPVAPDLHAIKRRSQRFYLGLGRAGNIAQHFGQIAALDSAVCILMRHIEQSSVGTDPMIGSLVGQIKRDEARHTLISRRHAVAVGISRDEYRCLGRHVHHGLVKMLMPLAHSFETIGVDTDRLFSRIRGIGLP